MEMSNTRVVPASQAETWKALNDPETLKACIPGCENMERVSATEYHMLLVAKVGPVNAKFKGKMQLANLDPPNAYTLTFEGQGGAAGFAKGSANVNLAPDGSGTQINYTVKAQIGGKLAQVGSRLIDGVAKKMAEDFFTAFTVRLGGTAPVVALDKNGAAVGGNKTWLWIAAAVVAGLIVYFIVR